MYLILFDSVILLKGEIPMKSQRISIFAIALALCMVGALLPVATIVPDFVAAPATITIAVAADDAEADIDAVTDELGTDATEAYDDTEEATDDTGQGITDFYNDTEADVDDAGADIAATDAYQDLEEELDDAGQNWVAIAIVVVIIAVVATGIYIFIKNKD